MNGAELAHEFFDAVEAGDQQAMARMYSEDAVVWHNYDQVEIPFGTVVRNLLMVKSLLQDFAYRHRRYTALPDGALLQHSLSGRLADGQLLDAPMAVRIYLRDGRIYRFEEYLDRGTTDALARAVSAQLRPAT